MSKKKKILGKSKSVIDLDKKKIETEKIKEIVKGC
jgi:hypothetical protein